MKIHRLLLQNFRGFEKLDLSLDPSLTLLIGENGAGKTAVLEALAASLNEVLSYIPSAAKGRGRWLGQSDARARIYEHEGLLDRQPQWPMRVSASGAFDGSSLDWECNLTNEMSHKDGRLLPVVQNLTMPVASGEARALPVIAYYGTRRLWPREEIVQARREIGSRFDGYVNALEADTSHRQLAEWMFQQTIVELQRRKEVPQLRAIERAVCQCTEGAKRFFFDAQLQDLVLEREGADPTPFSTLSDGYRNMVALVADVAWRASVLNPHFGADAAAQSEGVILIDEIDLHLHPRWQRRILGDLRRTFPRLQFVATTHSPQVISSARREEVRVFRDNALVEVQPFVEGRDTNSLLEDVLGVPERPEEARTRIDAMSHLLDEERYEEAKVAFEGLLAQLGPDDPAIIRARWIFDHEAPKGQG